MGLINSKYEVIKRNDCEDARNNMIEAELEIGILKLNK